jgi:light-regulated signal transduction histidine kinase (bacteriophytochrome)
MLQNEIRERKASEETVIELNRQLLENIARLEAANKDLDNFTFMASHDLQEPLRKIQTFSDMLHIKYKDALDEDAIFHITRIQKSARRMQVLIQDILDFSKLTVRDESFVGSDMNTVINELITDMQPTIAEKKAVVKVDNIPSLVVNPRMIRTLFQNLISNALKYSKKDDTPVINISAKTSVIHLPGSGNTKTKEYCQIFFKDNGIGFDQKYAGQIFEMFRRLHRGSDFEGAGIGLALCKKIVELHNGFISVISKVNEGSTFIVSLPVIPAEQNGETITKKAGPVSAGISTHVHD